MITKLVIENLGPIERVEVPLGRFTVLIGPNDSGKSTILRALQLLSYIGNAKPLGSSPQDCVFPPEVSLRDLTRGRSRSAAMRVGVRGQTETPSTDPFEFEYEIAVQAGAIINEALFVDGVNVLPNRTESVYLAKHPLSVETAWRDGISLLPQELSPGSEIARFAVSQELRSALLAPEPARLSAPCGLDVDPDELAEDGYGLAAVVDQILTSPNAIARMELETALRTFSPFVRGLGTRRSASGTGKEIVFALSDGVEVPAKLMSNGVLLALAFIALRHTDARRFLVEEPENGIHPRAVGEVVKALRATANLPGGQVIATTHSPLLLNYVDPTEALLVTRDEAHGVRVTPIIETPWFKERSGDFDLGELWYNVGERELMRERDEVQSAS